MTVLTSVAPLHQSTPEPERSFCETVNVTLDQDGIKHSFDHSMTSPKEPVSFLATSIDSNLHLILDVTGEQPDCSNPNAPAGERRTLPDECSSRATTPMLEGVHSRTSPTTRYLGQLAVTAPAEQESKEPATVAQSLSVTQFGNFVTSSDLEALEQRLETLASTKFEQSMSAHAVERSELTTGPSGGESTWTNQRRSAAERTPITSPGKRRPLRRSYNTETSDPVQTTSDEQVVVSKRPRPRMQLSAQMYKKHPVFKFFVTGPADPNENPHKWRCRVCQVELSLKTKGSLEILSHYRTDAHLVREHRIRLETPGLPLYDKNEQEITGVALDEAREKAEQTFPITPTLGECHLLPGQRQLRKDTEILDPSSVACSQMRLLLLGLQSGGELDLLTSLLSNLNVEAQGPTRFPQYDWRQKRVFVSIFRYLTELDIYLSYI